MFDPHEYDCSPQVEFAAKAFIASWLTNHEERLEQYLKDVPEEMQTEAHDVLIRLELYLRKTNDEAPDQIEYQERFPNYDLEIQMAFNPDASQLSPASPDKVHDQNDATLTDSLISESAGFLLARGEPDVIPDQVGRYKVERELGRGGFGVVCLAHDTQLDRMVALKFARTSRFNNAEEMEKLIDEARTAAKLDCPGIVSVYDVLVDEEYICIVQQLVEGHDLAEELAEGRPTFDEAAGWMVAICSAIAVAHSKGFIHRDLKPANILLDRESQPLITDFGLAIHESFQRRRRGDRSGTPRYMSPELVRGESHRIDGRSDIWSLGVILYQMLTGKKPFSGESAAEIFDEIKYREPRPPREIRPEIPVELERICLKCLSKPVAQRYSTARDLARDLKRWSQDAMTQSASDSMSDRISDVVPKGLRSFDEEDADFFLKLLPGPVGRSGLPDSVQAWKRRLSKETDDPLNVGVLYGPSGCGKSSYVKAGLLPYLPGNIKRFFVEATPADTELRLIKALRSRYNKIPSSLTLPELFQSIREGVWTEGGDRVLIVIDQFEQWLHNRNSFDGTELVEALRQCDGHRLQCLLMVRDDFWLATSRFLHAIEVDLVEGRNAALIDLFDVPHSERVLKQYGRGYGRIGEEITKQQEEFIEMAVAQLAEDGKVICVRLSLFAEMFKDKPWNVSSLRRAGGISGVGVAFLEDTFSSKNSPAKNRVHEVAARKVLGALLPESSVDIRGNMRSRQDLLHLSGYANRPNAFLELLNLLDHDLRLITPTDPSGLGDQKSFEPGASHDFYQLTHDYLVAPLRVWLYQKNRETAAGRAQLKLDERHATWTRTKENRFLPAVFEYLNIRALTRPKNWSAGERDMMGLSDRRYGVRFAIAAVVLGLAAFGGRFWYQGVQANSLIKRLTEAEVTDVPAIVIEMDRRHLRSQVVSRLSESDAFDDPLRRLKIDLALNQQPVSSQRLWEHLLGDCSIDEAVVISQTLQPTQEQREELWKLLHEPRELATDVKRLQAATALSYWAADDSAWRDVTYSAVGAMLVQNPINVNQWMEAMPNIRVPVIRELVEHASEWVYGTDTVATTIALELLKVHRNDWPELISHLQSRLTEFDFNTQFKGAEPVSNVAEYEKLSQRQANIATALFAVEAPEEALPLLDIGSHLRTSELLVEQLATFGIEAELLFEQLRETSTPEVRAALWLALGSYFDETKPLPDAMMAAAKEDHANHDHARVHSATEWLIRKVGDESWLDQQKLASQAKDYLQGRFWRNTEQGISMIRISAPGEFPMSFNRTADIDYDFEVSATEVTIEQAHRYFSIESDETLKQLIDTTLISPEATVDPLAFSSRRPIGGIHWFHAAYYCNWLSKKAGLPMTEWCYELDPSPAENLAEFQEPSESDDEKKMKPVLRLKENFRECSGYRMPLESEWEFLATPCVVDVRYHSSTLTRLLTYYEWIGMRGNANNFTRPCGLKKPGLQGLFDILGNAMELSSESYLLFEEQTRFDVADVFVPTGGNYADTVELSKSYPALWKSDYYRVSRGLSVYRDTISDNRDRQETTSMGSSLGFRVLRVLKKNQDE